MELSDELTSELSGRSKTQVLESDDPLAVAPCQVMDDHHPQSGHFNLNHTRGTVHLVGIAGAGMKALAELLHDRGWSVSGTDSDPDPLMRASLETLGIPIGTEHDPKWIPEKANLLIFSPAVADENPERQFCAASRIPQLSYIDCLQELLSQQTGIALAGTHGKSTTTALVGHILRHAGREPTVICGAELSGYRRNGWQGQGDFAVIEACEFRQHFLRLNAPVRCITGIESDHFDCYPSIEDTLSAFAQFARQTPHDGILVLNSDCQSTRNLSAMSTARSVSYSRDNVEADWSAGQISYTKQGTQFAIFRKGRREQRVRMSMPGPHNVENALATIALCTALGVSLQETCRGLESFAGLRRRLEYRGLRNSIPVYDDYAHHPTEVRAAIQAIRSSYPDSRILCVFQPHQITRTQKLFDEFVESLQLADQAFLLPVYAARERANRDCLDLSASLVDQIRLAGGAASLIRSLDQVWPTLQTDAGPDDVILTLGAGTITRIHNEFV